MKAAEIDNTEREARASKKQTNALASFRRSKRVTQIEVAKRLGYSESIICRIEQGNRTATRAQVKAMRQAIDEIVQEREARN
jgi:predicted transcriptional regulator